MHDHQPKNKALLWDAAHLSRYTQFRLSVGKTGGLHSRCRELDTCQAWTLCLRTSPPRMLGVHADTLRMLQGYAMRAGAGPVACMPPGQFLGPQLAQHTPAARRCDHNTLPNPLEELLKQATLNVTHIPTTTSFACENTVPSLTSPHSPFTRTCKCPIICPTLLVSWSWTAHIAPVKQK